MTSREKQVKDSLLELIEDAGKKLELRFLYSNNTKHRHNRDLILDDEETVTKAIRHINIVQLTLVEPFSDEDLDKWDNAIIKANELLKNIEKEIEWTKTNPNFFKAIQAYIEHDTNISLPHFNK